MTNHNDATEYPKEVGCETCDDQLCVDCYLNMKWNEGVEATLKHVIEMVEGMERGLPHSPDDFEDSGDANVFTEADVRNAKKHMENGDAAMKNMHYNQALTELKEKLEGMLEDNE